jgi:hypothetical protein
MMPSASAAPLAKAPSADGCQASVGRSAPIRCTLCGLEFTVAEAMAGQKEGACGGCKGCSKVKCPNCGMPLHDEPKTLSLVARLFARRSAP